MPFVVANAICVITCNFIFFKGGVSVNGVLFFLFCMQQNRGIGFAESVSSRKLLR